MSNSFFATAIHIATMALAITPAVMTTQAQAGKLHILYSFCGNRDPESGVCNDGSAPIGPVVRDANGNLFGTASGGGTHEEGTVFEISGVTQQTIYNFCETSGCMDGAVPLGGLVFDKSGNLYGTTQNGGPMSSGVVFELKHVAGGWKQTVLHDFCSKTQCADGGHVVSGLVIDDAGNLYGTTLSGGLGASEAGGGTVFEMTRSMTSGKWFEQVLYAFCSQSNCTDGGLPNAGVIRDFRGNIYGTTTSGGQNGAGTVFKLSQNATTKKWKEVVLYSFCSQPGPVNVCQDGAGPVAPLSMDKSGDLFGTAQIGGVGNPAFGVVFKLALKPSTGKYTFSVLYSFCQTNSSNCGDGDHPLAGVILDKSGNLYRTTASTISTDRFSNGGTVYRVTPAGAESLLVRFCQSVCKNGFSDGINPNAGLIGDASGNLYGTTALGGTHGVGGEVFEITK